MNSFIHSSTNKSQQTKVF